MSEIAKAVAAISAELESIQKRRVDAGRGGSYQAFSVDDVYKAVRLLLASHGVAVFPQPPTVEYLYSERQGGGVLTTAIYRGSWRLVASDGSNEIIAFEATSRDGGDKAPIQAGQQAFKYALVQTFQIPAGDPEGEKPPEDPVARPEPRSEPAPAKAEPEEPLDRIINFTLGKTPTRSTARQSGITLAVQLADQIGLPAPGEDSWAAWLEVALASFEKPLSQMTADETTALYETLQSAMAPASREAKKE